MIASTMSLPALPSPAASGRVTGNKGIWVGKRSTRAGLDDGVGDLGTPGAPLPARLQVENWSGSLPHTVEQDFYAALLRADCAPIPNPTGWRVPLNPTLVLKSLRHHLARLLLALDFGAVFARLLERLSEPAALEHTRPE